MLSEEEKLMHRRKANKVWRNANRDKYYAEKKDYYQRMQKFSDGKYRTWTNKEIQMIVDHKLPDRKLAEKIHRSVGAIQVMRSRLKKKD